MPAKRRRTSKVERRTPAQRRAQQSKIENLKSKIPTLAAYHRLARLTLADYDRARLNEARRLHIRPRVLDQEVARVRDELAQIEADNLQITEIIPWPEPVNGAELFLQISNRFTHHLALCAGAADVMSLWSGHTHVVHAFTHTPRLNLCAPEPECGKSSALDLIGAFSQRALCTENLKLAVLFRAIHKWGPTVVLDEVDNYLSGNKELIGLLNAGHKIGALAHRCQGGNVHAFKAFAAVALAGIGAIPRALQLRSIIIPMLKPRPSDIFAPMDTRDRALETELARKLARWGQDNFDAIRAAKPVLPPGIRNRLADNWRCLFAIAHVLGGDWPERILAAFYRLTANTCLDLEATNAALLHDIREVFLASGTDRLPSSELVAALLELPGRPWPEAQKNIRPITETWLARRLAPFGISPKFAIL